MKAAFGRFALIGCIFSAMTVLNSGCTVGGKSFAIDSNSRVPFFGLELKERKRKEGAPAYRSIARSSSDDVSVKVALQSFSSGPTVDVKKRSSQLVSTKFVTDSTAFGSKVANTARPVIAASTVSQNHPGKSFPLPRTDGITTTRDRRTSAKLVDFQ